jgi:septation ring formation regulator EzrA
MNYPPAERVEGMILWSGTVPGPKAPPGNYFVKLKFEKDSVEIPFNIKADPNYKCSQADYEAQFAFLIQVRDKFSEVQKGVKNIRELRQQINDFTGRLGKDCPAEIKTLADSISKSMTTIEETLYQTKAKSGQDVLNYPIRLNDKISGLYDYANSGYMAPSRQVKEAYTELAKQADAALSLIKQLLGNEVPKLNQLIREKMVPVIGLKKGSER